MNRLLRWFRERNTRRRRAALDFEPRLHVAEVRVGKGPTVRITDRPPLPSCLECGDADSITQDGQPIDCPSCGPRKLANTPIPPEIDHEGTRVVFGVLDEMEREDEFRKTLADAGAPEHVLKAVDEARDARRRLELHPRTFRSGLETSEGIPEAIGFPPGPMDDEETRP